MRQSELGEFLRSRRERVDPATVGFPVTDHHRLAFGDQAGPQLVVHTSAAGTSSAEDLALATAETAAVWLAEGS